MSFIKTLKVVFALMSVGLMAMGVCLMIWPGASVSAICVGLGVLAVVYGVVRMAGYFCNDLYRLAFQFDLAVGLLSILVGAVLLLGGGWMLDTLQDFTRQVFTLIAG